MRKPELLSPAGDWEKLRMAVLYGADAVYLAGTSFGMRSFAGNFSDEELPRAVRFAHEHGVKVHATVNTMPRWDEAEQLPAHLEKLDAAGVDALILADLGAFTLAGRYAPHCQRHISTQQSVANHVCAQAWYDLGASRVVLAREVSLAEIAAIRQRVSPQLELEAFCHGAPRKIHREFPHHPGPDGRRLRCRQRGGRGPDGGSERYDLRPCPGSQRPHLGADRSGLRGLRYPAVRRRRGADHPRRPGGGDPVRPVRRWRLDSDGQLWMPTFRAL